MKDREGFLLKLCIALFVCTVSLTALCMFSSCSSSAKVEISREVCYVE